MKHNFRVLLLVIAVALGALWLSFDQESKQSENSASAAPAVSANDYTVKTFSLTQFDEQGKPRHSISASAAAINQQTTELNQPVIVTQTADGQWHISAHQAISQNNFESLQLKQDVRIKKNVATQKVKNSELMITTEELDYSASNKQISSQKDINYQDGSMILTGTGLQANLSEEEFHILKNVKGVRHAK